MRCCVVKPHPDINVSEIILPMPNITAYSCFYYDPKIYSRGTYTYSKTTVKMAYGMGSGKVNDPLLRKHAIERLNFHIIFIISGD